MPSILLTDPLNISANASDSATSAGPLPKHRTPRWTHPGGTPQKQEQPNITRLQQITCRARDHTLNRQTLSAWFVLWINILLCVPGNVRIRGIYILGFERVVVALALAASEAALLLVTGQAYFLPGRGGLPHEKSKQQATTTSKRGVFADLAAGRHTK
jgi:hypothetical protein